MKKLFFSKIKDTFSSYDPENKFYGAIIKGEICILEADFREDNTLYSWRCVNTICSDGDGYAELISSDLDDFHRCFDEKEFSSFQFDSAVELFQWVTDELKSSCI